MIFFEIDIIIIFISQNCRKTLIIDDIQIASHVFTAVPLNDNEVNMRYKILVVEDSETMRKQIEDFIKNSEYDYKITDSAREAIKLIQADEFNIVLTDKNMPGINGKGDEGGMDILKYVKMQSPKLEVIILTAFTNIDTTMKALKMGAFDYIIKPFTKEDLLKTLGRTTEYLNYGNPEQTIEVYKKIRNGIYDIINEKTIIPEEERHAMMKQIASKLDLFFKS